MYLSILRTNVHFPSSLFLVDIWFVFLPPFTNQFHVTFFLLFKCLKIVRINVFFYVVIYKLSLMCWYFSFMALLYNVIAVCVKLNFWQASNCCLLTSTQFVFFCPSIVVILDSWLSCIMASIGCALAEPSSFSVKGILSIKVSDSRQLSRSCEFSYFFYVAPRKPLASLLRL